MSQPVLETNYCMLDAEKAEQLGVLELFIDCLEEVASRALSPCTCTTTVCKECGSTIPSSGENCQKHRPEAECEIELDRQLDQLFIEGKL